MAESDSTSGAEIPAQPEDGGGENSNAPAFQKNSGNPGMMESLLQRLEAIEAGASTADTQNAELTKAASASAKLLADNARLVFDNTRLTADNARLSAENARHASDIARLKSWAKEHRSP